MVADGDGARSNDLREVLVAAYEASRTGVVRVVASGGPVLVHLKEGKIAHVTPAPGGEWLLGRALVESGAISQRRLLRTQRKHWTTDRPLENLLIEQGVVTRDVLAKLLDLQMRETVVPLFFQQTVEVELRDEPPEVNDFARPIPIPFLVREIERRAREWPILQRLGLHRGQVYDKTDASVGRFLVPADEGADGEGQLSAAERVAYYYVNGRKTVAQVAAASFLGDFEAIRAIHSLERRGLVVLRERQGAGERPPGVPIVPVLVRVVFYVLLAAAVAGLALHRPPELREAAAVLTGEAELSSAAVRTARLARVRAGIELFHALEGRYPEALEALAEARLLSEDTVRWATPRVVYEPQAKGYRFFERASTEPR